MNKHNIQELLNKVIAGSVDVAEAASILETGIKSVHNIAQLDASREARTGIPEMVFGEGKSAEQIISIVHAFEQKGQNPIVSRIDDEKAQKVLAKVEGYTYDSMARVLYKLINTPKTLAGSIAVLTAGTSDMHIAEEAAKIAELLGAQVYRVYDVGVAGIHRLFNSMDVIKQAKAIIVVAGMDGALPSVVGGQVKVPVFAVPTSVGYGASFNGVAPLLTMLNSCAPGVSVVNIDNGFGAAICAVKLLKGGA